MAIYRATNNKKAYETKPSELIKKNEQSGEVIFSRDTIILGVNGVGGASAVANGDVIYCSKLPAQAKVLRVRVYSSGTAIAASNVTVGYSSSLVAGDKDNTIAAVGNAFIATWDPNAVDFADMGTVNTGYLAELEKPVYVTVTFKFLIVFILYLFELYRKNYIYNHLQHLLKCLCVILGSGFQSDHSYILKLL